MKIKRHKFPIKSLIRSCIGFSLVWLVLSCEDFVQINPPKNRLVTSTVFESNSAATAAVIGIYSTLTDFNKGFSNGNVDGVSILTGTSADELVYEGANTPQLDFLSNSLQSDNSAIILNWSTCYNVIYQCNAILEGLSNSTLVSQDVKHQLRGEALFWRAFTNFYLVNLWGDIPLLLTTDYARNSSPSRVDQAIVYKQILDDLNEAKTMLPNDYTFYGDQRVRANKFCASAMLARVYLFLGQWSDAESNSTEVIASTLYNLESNIDDVFRSTSREALLQLPITDFNYENFTNEGRSFIPFPSDWGIPPEYHLTETLLSAFEPGDQRSLNWVDSVDINGIIYPYAYKYKVSYRSFIYDPPFEEYSVVLRLAEQFLIRAEARAKQNNISGSQSDLDEIRTRSGLPNTMANSTDELLDAIIRERYVELFSEWGHRWLDLKRMGKSDEILGVTKAPNWDIVDALYPLPAIELERNPNLTQNPGY